MMKKCVFWRSITNCITRISVVADLHLKTFQDHVQKDFLVGSQDVERSTISFFTILTVKVPKSLMWNKSASISNKLLKTSVQLVEQPQYAYLDTRLVRELSLESKPTIYSHSEGKEHGHQASLDI